MSIMLRQLSSIGKRTVSNCCGNKVLWRGMSTKADYICVHVFVSCKPGTEEAFRTASLANARASAKEPGIARFDVVQEQDAPSNFLLVEVYKNKDAPAEHKKTEHYNTWRESVADMMAEPRRAIKYNNVFPATTEGWDYDDTDNLE
eukprot:498959_1